MLESNSAFISYFLGLAENSQDVFWIRGTDGRQGLYVSPAYEQVWGHSCEFFYQQPEMWIDSVHLEDQGLVKEWLATRENMKVAALAPKEIIYRIVKPDGTICWIKDSCSLIFDSGKLIGFAGIAKNITQIKLKEQELLEFIEKAEQANQQKTKYLLSLQNSSNASINQVLGSDFFMQLAEKSESVFWVRSSDYGIQLYVSPAYEKIWQRSRGELFEHPEKWNDYLHPEEQQALQSKLYERNPFAKPEAKYDNIYRILRPSGEIRWIKDTSFPINNTDDKCIGFAGIAVDITEDKLKKQALLEAKENAEAANRAKSAFLATMSHELRTPLNGILGIAQILTSEQLSVTQKEYVDDIMRASHHLLSIVNDMLDFAKLEAGKVELQLGPLDLKKVFQEVVHIMDYQAQLKGLSLNLVFDDSIPHLLLGDPKVIRQIMVNLIGNAIKFTEKGWVVVEVKALVINEVAVKFNVTVSDSGIGIPIDKLDTIFEQFEQVDSSQARRYGGTGLGLSITKYLVELMGGMICVTSKYKEGTQFCLDLELPLQEAAKEVDNSWEQQQSILINQSDQKQKMHALLVEDNPLNQKIGKIMLEDIGFEVQIAENGQQVLANDLFSFDLIFMDVGLPDISGIDITKQIRNNERYQSIPIIAMTAHAYQSDKDACLNAGMNDVVTKPVMKKELIEIVAKWLNKL